MARRWSPVGGRLSLSLSIIPARVSGRHEEEAYREVIISYEARQKQLLVENSGMRQCLKNLQKELISLLNAPDDDTQAKLVAMQVRHFTWCFQ